MSDVNEFLRWQVGSIRVTRIMELPPQAFDPAIFIQADRTDILEHAEWLCPHYATGNGDIVLHFQAFVIEAAGKRILVDPCIGNDKPRGHPLLDQLDNPFLERLEAAGFPPESFDYVMCTHLHVDHCGWNTRLVDGRWVPTFPQARYLFAAGEVEFARTEVDGDAPAIFADSVQPIIDAGLADFITPDYEVVPGVNLFASPGHTPGHCSIRLTSDGETGILTGDVMHHPIQIARPEIASNFCWDLPIGEATRRAMLDEAETSALTLFVPHFAGTSAVSIRRDEKGWRPEQV